MGGSSSSGSAPVDVTTHSGPPYNDVDMESAEVGIPMSVTGTKRVRDSDLEVGEGVATQVLVTPSVGTRQHTATTMVAATPVAAVTAAVLKEIRRSMAKATRSCA